MPADHQHRLQRCSDCDATGVLRGGEGWEICPYCEGRGYDRPEVCEVCGEPMGNRRRRWKREHRSTP